jgi:hypothetical protein
MKTRTFLDKTTWAEGPWHTECDEMLWIDAETGMQCQMIRTQWGSWQGAVGVPPSHPLYMVSVSDPQVAELPCHGGIAFAMFDVTADQAFTPPSRMWWIGFRCLKSDDLQPNKPPSKTRAKPALSTGIRSDSPKRKKPVYRDSLYVQHEVSKLAKSLIGIELADPAIKN